MDEFKGWEENKMIYILNPREESVLRSKILVIVQVE
jgi:hypothetical protein